jgi:NADP-dependent 3-hydroxy acid dehydrogenase YdfG
MKQAIVLGASSGMGRKVSEMLLKEGWHVGVAARRMEALNELADSFPGRVEVMQIDVMADDAPQRLLELIDKVGVLTCISMLRESGSRTCCWMRRWNRRR